MSSKSPEPRVMPSSPTAEYQSFGSQSSNGGEDYTFSFQMEPSEASTTDKFAHTRGKRKRTSRADFAVLEAEYQRNPRPDKAARGSIVSRVSLCDKEVQIWFQNRRQMTRRKCKTWQPNEITSIIRSSQDSKVEEQDSSQTSDSMDEPLSHQMESSAGVSANKDEEGSFPALSNASQSFRDQQGMVNTYSGPASTPSSAPVSVTPQLITQEGDEQRATAKISENSTNLVQTLPQMTDRSTTTDGETFVDPPPESGSTAARAERGPLQRSSSLRLSMSLDGKAKVVMGEGSPSPPKKPQAAGFVHRSGALQRSQSLITPTNQNILPSAGEHIAWPKSRPHGRSRDARTWEFYCDTDARNTLTKAAELDQKGSALGVIGLIRSGSGGRKPLTPVRDRKENAQLVRADSGKRKILGDHNNQKPKLARTTSSVARLQSIASSAEAFGKSDTSSDTKLWQEPSSDSDKENHDPHKGMPRRNPVSRPPASRHPRHALQENTTIMSHSSSLGALMEKESSLSARKLNHQRFRMSDKENRDQDLDEEVEAFMGAPSKAARGEDEMDAVQNLLSLSQGAWR